MTGTPELNEESKAALEEFQTVVENTVEKLIEIMNGQPIPVIERALQGAIVSYLMGASENDERAKVVERFFFEAMDMTASAFSIYDEEKSGNPTA